MICWRYLGHALVSSLTSWEIGDRARRTKAVSTPTTAPTTMAAAAHRGRRRLRGTTIGSKPTARNRETPTSNSTSATSATARNSR
jgi:hypothetical protein